MVTPTPRNNYALLSIAALIVVAGTAYFILGDVNLNGNSSVPIENSQNPGVTAINNSKPVATESKSAASHFTCEKNKSIDGTFTFEGGGKATLVLMNADGTKRTATLTQDMKSATPIFKSNDGQMVLLNNKGDGSVSLQENGAITFANCKPS